MNKILGELTVKDPKTDQKIEFLIEEYNQEKETMSEISYLYKNNCMTLFLDGNSYQVLPDHPNFKKIQQLLAEDGGAEEILGLVNIPQAIKERSDGKVEIKYGEVYYNNKPLHNSLTERMLEMFGKGFHIDPMLKFLERLMQNPSARAISELYDFLENRDLKLSDDGCFFAYKTVRPNFHDWHSNKIDNSPGKVVSLPRHDVDDDRSHECSFGLHVGSMNYLNSYHPDGRYLLIKVDPRDCVSVPRDHFAQKLRVCRYEVVKELEKKESLVDPVYSSDGDELDPWEDDIYDDLDDDWNEEILLDDIRQEALHVAEGYNRDQLVNLVMSYNLFDTKEDARAAKKRGMIYVWLTEHMYFPSELVNNVMNDLGDLKLIKGSWQ